MIRVCHLLDDRADWEWTVGLAQLWRRLPSPLIEHIVVRLRQPGRHDHVPSLGEDAPDRSRQTPLANDPPPATRTVTLHPGPLVLSTPRFRRALATLGRIDLIHAWGLRPARIASLLPEPTPPRLITCSHPGLAREHARLLGGTPRSTADHQRGPDTGNAAIVCTAGAVRRRLVEHGVPMDRCVLIRPAVDFGRINRILATNPRADLGLEPHHRAVLIDPSTTRTDREAIDSAWAIALRTFLDHNLRLLIPGGTSWGDRLRHLLRHAYRPDRVIFADLAIPLDRLICLSDTLLVSTDADVPTTSLAWAMAGGTLILAPAGYAVAELIAHRRNGLLFNPRSDAGFVVAVARCLKERTDVPAMLETARGQAYEVFSLKSYADSHLALYENILADRQPDEGILDPASVA